MQHKHKESQETNMKMSKVAKMIGVDRRTIYNWVTHEALEHLFSERARNEGDRELNEQDIFIVNTINHLRQNITTDWDEIAQKIEGGYQVTELSIGATEVDTGKTPIQQFTRMIAIAKERDTALKQLEEARAALDQIESQYEAKLDELREQYEKRLYDEQSQRREEFERLMREASEREGKLQRELGKLEAMIDLLQKKDDDD